MKIIRVSFYITIAAIQIYASLVTGTVSAFIQNNRKSICYVSTDLSWWSLIFYLSGKFCITVAYSSVYIYVSEVFPTNVRQSLLAVCSSTGRVGSTLAPLTPLLVSAEAFVLILVFSTSFALTWSLLLSCGNPDGLPTPGEDSTDLNHMLCSLPYAKGCRFARTFTAPPGGWSLTLSLYFRTGYLPCLSFVFVSNTKIKGKLI